MLTSNNRWVVDKYDHATITRQFKTLIDNRNVTTSKNNSGHNSPRENYHSPFAVVNMEKDGDVSPRSVHFNSDLEEET